MVIMTAKLSKGKLIAALVLILAVVIATILICSKEPAAPRQELDTEQLTAVTNDDRIAFLTGFGWSVGVDPVSTRQVRIPTETSEVFDRYNQLQRSQGFDLTQYAGQTVDQYVYEILNYAAVPSASASSAASGFVSGQQVSQQTIATPGDTSADGSPDTQTAPSEDGASAPQVTVTTQDTPVYATILVCDGVIIGGDVSAADPTGIMHGFAKP